MKQIIILGASSVYGVGAKYGWADLVKSYVHASQYAADGPGEYCEVFNFAKSGSTVEFVANVFPWVCEHYQRGPELTTIVSVGGNDAKASNSPDNYVCTPEDFRKKMLSLCTTLKAQSKRVIFMSNGYLDEAKLNPKINPFNASRSYFTNARRNQFNAITKEICDSLGFEFVANECDQATWTREYLYKDGLHPNQKGHELMFEALKPKLDEILIDKG